MGMGVESMGARIDALVSATLEGRMARQAEYRQDDTLPERRDEAQDIVLKEHSHYLTPEQVVLICDILGERKTHHVELFLKVGTFEYRKAWIGIQLKRAGYPLNADG
jgi:hypothetical protein